MCRILTIIAPNMSIVASIEQGTRIAGTDAAPGAEHHQ
jgi:hypothetical protein